MDRDKKRTLLLVRTPFQAWLAEKVLNYTNVSHFDLVYFTYHNSTKDRFYFSRLSRKSGKSFYINVRRRNREAIHHGLIYLTNFFARGFRGYDQVMLASFDNYLFRMLARRQRRARLVTFDDGTANIYPQSSYHCYRPSRLGGVYDLILGASSREEFKKDIDTHYTIYHSFSNIVEDERVEIIQPWADGAFISSGEQAVSFFIGQPFDEVVASGTFDMTDLYQLESLIESRGIDYYLQHPRETHPLDVGGALINDAERISEEIIAQLCAGRKAIVYAWFSTVLFNLPADQVRKIYISVGDNTEESVRTEMCKRVGCEILSLCDVS